MVLKQVAKRRQEAVNADEVTPVKAARKMLQTTESPNPRWNKTFLNRYLVSTKRVMRAGDGVPVDLGVATDASRVGEKECLMTAIKHRVSELTAWAPVQDTGRKAGMIGRTLWRRDSNVAFR